MNQNTSFRPSPCVHIHIVEAVRPHLVQSYKHVTLSARSERDGVGQDHHTAISDDDVLEVLRLWAFKANKHGTNVFPKGATYDTCFFIRFPSDAPFSPNPSSSSPCVTQKQMLSRYIQKH